MKVGLLISAFKFNAVCCRLDIGLSISALSSTEDNPIIAFVIPPTVPVKVGLSIGALESKSLLILLNSLSRVSSLKLTKEADSLLSVLIISCLEFCKFVILVVAVVNSVFLSVVKAVVWILSSPNFKLVKAVVSLIVVVVVSLSYEIDGRTEPPDIASCLFVCKSFKELSIMDNVYCKVSSIPVCINAELKRLDPLIISCFAVFMTFREASMWFKELSMVDNLYSKVSFSFISVTINCELNLFESLIASCLNFCK